MQSLMKSMIPLMYSQCVVQNVTSQRYGGRPGGHHGSPQTAYLARASVMEDGRGFTQIFPAGDVMELYPSLTFAYSRSQDLSACWVKT